MSTIEEKEMEKLRKGKRDNSPAFIYWAISTFISVIVIAFGFIEYQNDYRLVNTTLPQLLTNPRTGVEEPVYPVFGFLSVPTGNQGFIPNSLKFTIHHFIVVGIILFIGIPAIGVYLREARRLKAIDDNLPFLLREIADSQRIGMHLPRAILEASKRNYGPLTPELKKLAAKVSWGVPFRDAMNSFKNNVQTPLAKQATILILEAERSGGNLEEIFDAAQKHVQEILDIKREREAQIKPYVYIIYASYVIFIVVIWVLFATFFEQFGTQEIVVNNVEVIPIPIHAFRNLFLYVLTSQALFSGMTAGKMGSGTIKIGLSHSTFLMVVALLAHIIFIAK